MLKSLSIVILSIVIILLGLIILDYYYPLNHNKNTQKNIERTNKLKSLLENYHYDKKKRYGVKGDGGYVIAEIEQPYDCYISCGISNEESFTRDFLKKHSYLEKKDCYAFDGTIKDYPWKYTKNINWYKKNINRFNDDKNTNLNDIFEKYNNIFLKMDIEGWEYPWILDLPQGHLNKISQMTIEFHGVCGKNYSCNATFTEKVKVLEKLNKTHYIIHSHGNNSQHSMNGIPILLELTFIHKKYLKNPMKNYQKYPIQNLDYPCKQNLNFGLFSIKFKDFELNKYPFVNNNTKI